MKDPLRTLGELFVGTFDNSDDDIGLAPIIITLIVCLRR